MVARDFAGAGFRAADRLSLMNNFRPLSSVTEAIWALATTENRASVTRIVHAAMVARLTILPWGRRADRVAIEHKVSRFTVRPYIGHIAAAYTTIRLPRFQISPCPRAGNCLPADTLLALECLIPGVRSKRGGSEGHFLGQMCPFRQPPPGRVAHRPSRPPVWPTP